MMRATYCYTTRDGETTVAVPREHRQRNRPVTLPDGQKAYRDREAEWRQSATMHSGDPWADHESIALGVNPSQAKEAEKWHADRGVPTQFDDRTGRAKIRNRRHRQQVCAIRGLYDVDAGYGDATPNNL